MNDPILQTATLLALIFIPVISVWLSKIKLKYIFIPPILAMAIAFPMFLFVVIVSTLPISRLLFYISMSLWTGGLFALFIALYIYHRKKKKRN
ncbi:MAG: hypothetical protein R6U15_08245 [Candidatus Izemoplasmatales bacterium]